MEKELICDWWKSLSFLFILVGMKNLLAFLLILTFSFSYSQSSFCNGWEKGYQKGKQSCASAGVTPVCPVPDIGSDNYSDGYGLGYAKAKAKCGGGVSGDNPFKVDLGESSSVPLSVTAGDAFSSGMSVGLSGIDDKIRRADQAYLINQSNNTNSGSNRLVTAMSFNDVKRALKKLDKAEKEYKKLEKKISKAKNPKPSLLREYELAKKNYNIRKKSYNESMGIWEKDNQ